MKAEKTYVYCKGCVYWRWRSIFDQCKDRGQCLKVISVDKDRPVEPKKVYGSYRLLNEDNDCEHYEPKPPEVSKEAKVPWWKFWR